MRSSCVVGMLALVFVASGCAFTRWTDRAYLGTTGGAPNHEGRLVTGLVLVPFAIAGDVVTFPIQALVLIIGGDDALKPSERPRRDLGAAVDARARARLEAIRGQMTARGDPPSLYGIDGAGDVVPLDLSRERVDGIVARVAVVREQSPATEQVDKL